MQQKHFKANYWQQIAQMFKLQVFTASLNKALLFKSVVSNRSSNFTWVGNSKKMSENVDFKEEGRQVKAIAWVKRTT